MAQLNFTGPELLFAKFWEVLIWQLISKDILVRDMGNMAPSRARVRVSPAGLGQWIVNWLGKVELDKLYLNYKTRTVIMYLNFSRDSYTSVVPEMFKILKKRVFFVDNFGFGLKQRDKVY